MAFNYNVINRYNTLINQIQKNNNMNDNMVGDLKWSVRTNDFFGWLKCDGRLVSKSEYSQLFDLIGHDFSNAAVSSYGTTYFRLPDARSRVLGMVGPSRTDTIDGNILSTREMGDVTGNETHTLTIPEMPQHNHTGNTTSNGLHNHGGSTGTDGYSASAVTLAGVSTGGLGTDVANDTGSHNHSISSDGEHVHDLNINMRGNSLPHNNMQPTLFIGSVFIFSGVDINNN
jgi:microcystin-dependent protein